MTEIRTTTNRSRRSFLGKLFAFVGGALAVAASRRTAAAKAPAPSPPQLQESRGYRVTEHIRRYYDSARF